MINVQLIKTVVSSFTIIVFFSCPAVFGAQSREEIESFLKAPSAVEIFQGTKGRKVGKSDSQESPLVKQAQAFALYLDPPPKPAAKAPSKSGGLRGLTPRPAVVNTKFDLFGTCYYAGNPKMSLALIKETGKGMHWVRQGSSVGRLVIEEIEDGQVTVRDNKRTFKLVAKREKKKSLVKSSSAGTSPDEAVVKLFAGKAEKIPKIKAVAKIEAAPEISPEETALLEKFFTEMEALESGQDQDGDSQQLREEGVAMMDQLLAELDNVRISTEEANQLDSLGRELQEAREQSGGVGEANAPNETSTTEKPSSSDK